MEPNELLNQLSGLIADVERLRADAEKWQTLIRITGEMGYGPRLTPQAVASLLPHPGIIAGIAEASQEVPPTATAAPKSRTGRRIVSDAERQAIHAKRADGFEVSAIAAELGLSTKTVYGILASANGDGS